ncbi:MAG: FHA domain-containing protein, partial [Bacteroidota bacterium]
MRKILPLLLSVSLLLATHLSVRAQASTFAEISAIDTRAFPKVAALMNAFASNGDFIAGLKPSDVTVYEDGQPRPVDTLEQTSAPAQIVVGINPGPALGVRDGTGVTRFSRVVEALGNWVNAQPENSKDDLSLVSLSGSLISHGSARDWFVSLDSFKPDFRATTPNLQSLAIALDTVNAPALEPGMQRAILFITPHMDDPDIDKSIAPFIQQAIDTKVRVFVWFIDADTQFNSPSANAFRLLAQQTNGGFFPYSGKEQFPDPSQYFAPLRNIYSLSYTSAATTSDDHTLGLKLKTPDGEITAPDKTFQVDVQPPNPIFISPPLQITRQPPTDDPYSDNFTPSRQPLEILVEFPDGHPRDLKRTTLLVDGKVVDENTSAPFEKFIWKLDAYTESGQHEIVAQVEDTLGLSKSSIAIPVALTVVQPPGGIRGLVGRYSSYIIIGAIALAGLLLLAILLRGRMNIGIFKRRKARRRQMEDPVTQPVIAAAEPPTSATKKVRTQPRKAIFPPKPARVLMNAPAYLTRLTNGGEPASAAPIPLAERDMTFGTDPVQSKRVLDDPSISPLHARIRQTEDGSFIIYDHGSIAGTWVNYEPVTREGQRLVHGDRIHIGQMVYRFDLNPAPADPE